MAVTVHLPKVGMTMEEGTLVRWLVPDGALVERGTTLFEMETEKVEIEVQSDGDGTLRQLVSEGMRLQPGGIVGCVLASDERDVPADVGAAVAAQWSAAAGSDAKPPAAAGAAATGAPAPPPPPPPAAAEPPRPVVATVAPPPAAGAAGAGRVVASPIARRLAAELGVDLTAVAGTGPNGRVTEQDVRGHAETRGRDAAAPAAAAAPARGVGTTPYSGRRRMIGERMRQSLQAMAQLTLVSETRVDEATRMVHGLNREWRSERVVVTLTALVVKACALALRDHPALNARLDGDQIVSAPDVNIGFAVDVDEGLIVPVVHHADALSLRDVARAVADLTERAKAGSLGLPDVSGGTFTVTSLDGTVVDAFTPVVNPPQAAILGVGRVRDVPVFEGGAVERGQVTALSLTIDHRVLDGAPAARFLARVAELLSRPYVLM